LKDAWAYDEDEEEDDVLGIEGSEVASEGGSSATRRFRASILASSTLTHRKIREGGVEKRGNVSKVGIEVEMLPNASGPVDVSLSPGKGIRLISIPKFDLEVRYTYRVDEPPPTPDKAKAEQTNGKDKTRITKEEFKTFTFWIRVPLGKAEPTSNA